MANDNNNSKIPMAENEPQVVRFEEVTNNVENMANAVQNSAITVSPEEVPKLDHKKALAAMPEDERRQVLELADKINMREIEKVMNYGASVLEKTFDECGEFLKDERGSTADQMVMQQVIELSKKASDSYDDFNLILKEPNFLQKLLLKISTKHKKERSKEIQNAAITNYKLLTELKESSSSWIEMLKTAMGEITESAMLDIETMATLQKYIIAGKLAQEKVPGELAEIKQKFTETGLIQYSQEYDEYEEGAKIFDLTLANLETSYDLYYLSLGQLKLIRESNKNVQISINSQMRNTLTAMSQQIRNAVLNAKNREVLEGQKAINRLNDELIMEISRTVGLTAEETEKMLYTSFVNVEAAQKAVTAIIESCNAVQKTGETMLPEMKNNVAKLTGLIEQLEPHVEKIRKKKVGEVTSANTPKIGTSSASAQGELEF